MAENEQEDEPAAHAEGEGYTRWVGATAKNLAFQAVPAASFSVPLGQSGESVSEALAAQLGVPAVSLFIQPAQHEPWHDGMQFGTVGDPARDELVDAYTKGINEADREALASAYRQRCVQSVAATPQKAIEALKQYRFLIEERPYPNRMFEGRLTSFGPRGPRAIMPGKVKSYRLWLMDPAKSGHRIEDVDATHEQVSDKAWLHAKALAFRDSPIRCEDLEGRQRYLVRLSEGGDQQLVAIVEPHPTEQE